MNNKYLFGLIAAIAVAFAAKMMNAPSGNGWTSLFNGKDLTGWRASPAVIPVFIFIPSMKNPGPVVGMKSR